MHASVALASGARLVFCINPLVPVDTRKAVQQSILPSGQVILQGLPSVLSQSIRTMIHSRMSLGLRAYQTHFPDADVVLIEPPRQDHEFFFSNIFSFASRRATCEHAFHSTRRGLCRREKEIAEILERHGLRLNRDFLHTESWDFWSSVGLPELSESEPPPPAAEEPVVEELEDLLRRVERLVERERGLVAAG